jgi:methenyltetrahydrofolate cyclohydrolase
MRSMMEPIHSTSETTVGAFSQALASSQPTPGGGAAAAVTASLGASLIAMVVRLSCDRPRYQQHADLHAEALSGSEAARGRLLELADEDAASYADYVAARSLPHDTEAESSIRVVASRDAARGATTVPLAVARICHGQLDLADRLVGRTNVNVASDLEVAALLCESAARGAASNVRANLPSIGDVGYTNAVVAELDQRMQQIQSAADRVRERIAKGGQRPPEGG